MDKNIMIVNDNKFKSIFITVNYIRELNKKEAGKNALLASILKKGTKNLRTEEQMELEMAKLYASNVDVSVQKIGGYYDVEFSAELLNKKYINEDVLDKVINILYDVINNPNLENGVFSKEVFNREKEALIEKIKQEQNDKRRWALIRLEQEMYKHDEYSVQSLGDIKEIEKETEYTIYEYYKEFLETSQIKIVITGNIEGYDNIEDKIKEKFLTNRVSIKMKKIKNREEYKEVKEYEKLSQSVLCLGAYIDDNDVNNIPKIAIYNSLLGGTPSSKLFQNVREKESLAYFAKSQYNKYINAIYIYSGVNLNNVDKAISVINEQLESLKKGEITAEELTTAKKNIELLYRSLSDSKISYNRMLLANDLFYGNEFNLKQFVEDVKNVTKEDVIKIANNVKVNTLYLLGGNADE